jgi:carbon storage regulator CsrA
VLVLSRKKNEDIVITIPDGRVITIKVVDIVGDKVRLGVTAAPDVSVMRRELLTQPEKKPHGLERPAT